MEANMLFFTILFLFDMSMTQIRFFGIHSRVPVAQAIDYESFTRHSTQSARYALQSRMPDFLPPCPVSQMTFQGINNTLSKCAVE